MEKISVQQLFEMKNVAQPQVANNLLFFTETAINKEENTYQTKILSVDEKTGNIQQWGNQGITNTSIAISPDASQLAFLSTSAKGKKPQVCVMPITGGASSSITDEEQGVSQYFWSHDNRFLYIQTSETINKDANHSDKQEQLPKPTIIERTTYKFDETGIIPNDIKYLVKKVDVQSKTSEIIFEHIQPFTLKYVAKNQSFILYSIDSMSNDEWDMGREAVYQYTIATKEVRLLTESHAHGSFTFVASNVDDQHFVFVGNENKYGFTSQNKLYSYCTASNQLTCLTENFDEEVSDVVIGDFQQDIRNVQIDWIDDTLFIFPVSKHGKTIFYSYDVISNKIEEILNRDWHVTGSAIIHGENPRLLVTYSTLTKPSELAVVDLMTKEVTVLYNPNADFEKVYAYSQPERFWYKGYDDWDIQGWYIPPIEATEQHPAVLYIHGGPQVAYGETFFFEMQVLAAQGYGVIMLNPRGGNSYGQAFVSAILGDYANHDYDDLMMGLEDVLKRHPEINQQQLYVTGGSYGGFMTNWIVTHNHRFKAAVTQRSISNWISFYGTSDVGPFFVEKQLLCDLSQMEKLWKMSPLAYAHQAKTPLLILHGEADLRCPIEQAEQFYTAMKKHNVVTKFVRFPLSSHGLSRTGLPNLRVERMEHIISWFNEN